jgi:DNA-directed RNA polymerase subunit RPC12/RpoP
MRAERSLRLPLQIGTSALYSLARGSLLAVPGVILFTIAVAIVLWIGDLGDASGYLFVALATPGTIISTFAYKHLKRAHAERPSDLMVTATGFAINGGPLHGKRIDWTDVSSIEIRVPEKPSDRDKVDNSDLCIMKLTRMDATLLDLAAVERAGEKESLRELAETLSARIRHHGDDDDETPAKPPAAGVFVCSDCGVAIAPADAPTVVCPYCAHTTEVPEAMRAQIRDSDTLQHKPDRAINKLLDQPGATLVGTLFVVASAFMLLAWPLAIVLMVIEYSARSLTWPHAGLLVGFVTACVLGFYGLIRTRLVDRQALRLLAVEFAAVEPATPGAPYRCQHCVAPLPAAGDARVIVRCVYCGTDNVLGLHLGREASIAREETRSLEAAMARRKREHHRWRGVTIVALGLLVAAWFALEHGVKL